MMEIVYLVCFFFLFHFSQFSLEDEDLCNHDFVEVREGGAGGPLLGRFCGLTVPTNITVGNNLWVKFRSNEAIPGQGFRAEFNACKLGYWYLFLLCKALHKSNDRSFTYHHYLPTSFIHSLPYALSTHSSFTHLITYIPSVPHRSLSL